MNTPRITANTMTVAEYNVRTFMSNVDKLDKYVHTQTHSDLGSVRLVKAAYENKGKRKFAVKSNVIQSGSYTRAGLMNAFMATI